ncbi:MAG TPA: hypothetical protein VKP88_07670 [Candidatus Paceibacterota bacterium]|nr:hypothetical protein [Candidatus Paceibacterota bacterium]
MTAAEFTELVLLCRRDDDFIIETYSMRRLPNTPWETFVREDDMLRDAGIMQWGVL